MIADRRDELSAVAKAFAEEHRSGRHAHAPPGYVNASAVAALRAVGVSWHPDDASCASLITPTSLEIY